MTNLHDALVEEIIRCSLAVEEYMAVPAGQWAGREIQMDLDNAKEALSEMDVVKMMSAYKELKEVEF